VDPHIRWSTREALDERCELDERYAARGAVDAIRAARPPLAAEAHDADALEHLDIVAHGARRVAGERRNRLLARPGLRVRLPVARDRDEDLPRPAPERGERAALAELAEAEA